jgi:site-specific DNA-methyltransferase (adenine-specific)
MSDADFRSFLVDAFKAADEVLAPGGAFYIAHADSEGFNFRGAVRDVGWKTAQCLVWVKDRFVMGRQDYQWRHEPILYGWKEGAAHHALTDRTQDTVWLCDRPAKSEQHPTMKPIDLVERAVANSSNHGEAVLDLFGGSGTTLLACERRERAACLMELDPAYCDVIVERWERYTGRKALRGEPAPGAAGANPKAGGNPKRKAPAVDEPATETATLETKPRGKQRPANEARRRAG